MVKDPVKDGKRNFETCLSIRVRNPEFSKSTSRIRYPEFKWISVDLVRDPSHRLEEIIALVNEEVSSLLSEEEEGTLTPEMEAHMKRLIYFRATMKKEVIDRRKLLGRSECLFYKEFFDKARDIMSPDAFQEILAAIPKEVIKAGLLCPPRRIRK